MTQFLGPLQRAVSCVTHGVLNAPDGYRPRNVLVGVVLNDGEPVRLRGPERIHLRVRMRVRLFQMEPPRGLWEAATAAYDYRLSDQDDREIVAYHWHPEGQSHVQTPHLHLGPGAEIGRVALLRVHLPTGPVPVQGVLRLAVEALAVDPARRDWERVLQAAEAAPA